MEPGRLLLYTLAVLGLVCVQKVLYLLLIDRKRVHELEVEKGLLKSFGDKERVEKNNHKYLFQTSVPSALSSLIILFSFGFIHSAFGNLVVTLPFKIPGIVRGFPPFGMRNYFGWLYLFTVFLVIWAIIVGKIVYYVEEARYSRQSEESNKKGEGF